MKSYMVVYHKQHISGLQYPLLESAAGFLEQTVRNYFGTYLRKEGVLSEIIPKTEKNNMSHFTDYIIKNALSLGVFVPSGAHIWKIFYLLTTTSSVYPNKRLVEWTPNSGFCWKWYMRPLKTLECALRIFRGAEQGSFWVS